MSNGNRHSEDSDSKVISMVLVAALVAADVHGYLPIPLD